MRSRILASLLIGLGCLIVANADTCAERRNPAVVIDSWWSGHYAESGCQDATKFFDDQTASRIRNFGCGSVPSCPEFMSRSVVCTSGGSPREQADRFESRLVAEFTTDPACKGASIARYQGPDRALSAADQA